MFNNEDFHKKLFEHHEKSLKLMDEMKQNKKQNDQDKQTHANFKENEFTPRPGEVLANFIHKYILIYYMIYILDHWFGDQRFYQSYKRIHNYVYKNEEQK